MTITELADFLQLHPTMQLRSSDIYRSLRRGQLGGFRVGAGWGFRREAIEHLVERTSSRRSAS